MIKNQIKRMEEIGISRLVVIPGVMLIPVVVSLLMALVAVAMAMQISSTLIQFTIITAAAATTMIMMIIVIIMIIMTIMTITMILALIGLLINFSQSLNLYLLQ